MIDKGEIFQKELEELVGRDSKEGLRVVFRLDKVIKLAKELKLQDNQEFLEELEQTLDGLLHGEYMETFIDLGSMFSYLMVLRASTMSRLNTTFYIGDKGVLFKVTQDTKADVINLEMYMPKGTKVTVA